jgi:hypothetical protein
MGFVLPSNFGILCNCYIRCESRCWRHLHIWASSADGDLRSNLNIGSLLFSSCAMNHYLKLAVHSVVPSLFSCRYMTRRTRLTQKKVAVRAAVKPVNCRYPRPPPLCPAAVQLMTSHASRNYLSTLLYLIRTTASFSPDDLPVAAAAGSARLF